MIARKTTFSNTVRILLVGACVSLAACHSDFGPHPMPSGYMHHGKAHKSPAGPEPVWRNIKHKMNHEHTKECKDMPNHPAHMTQAAPETVAMSAPRPAPVVAGGHWDMAAQDLVSRMVAGLGQPAEPVYVRPANPTSDAEMHLEKALRGAMLQRNFDLAPAMGMGPYVADYAISPIQGLSDGSRKMVSFSLSSHGQQVAQESGIYDLGPAMMPPAVQDMPDPYEESDMGDAVAEPVVIWPGND